MEEFNPKCLLLSNHRSIRSWHCCVCACVCECVFVCTFCRRHRCRRNFHWKRRNWRKISPWGDGEKTHSPMRVVRAYRYASCFAVCRHHVPIIRSAMAIYLYEQYAAHNFLRLVLVGNFQLKTSNRSRQFVVLVVVVVYRLPWTQISM